MQTSRRVGKGNLSKSAAKKNPGFPSIFAGFSCPRLIGAIRAQLGKKAL
jgi:hypothetical protein